MPSDFTGTAGSNRHYSTGTIEEPLQFPYRSTRQKSTTAPRTCSHLASDEDFVGLEGAFAVAAFFLRASMIRRALRFFPAIMEVWDGLDPARWRVSGSNKLPWLRVSHRLRRGQTRVAALSDRCARKRKRRVIPPTSAPS